VVMRLAWLLLISRHRAFRHLVTGVLRDSELAGDLRRLAALRRGVERGALDVRPSLEDDGSRLFLESRPGIGEKPEEHLLAVPSAPIREMVCNHHTAVGETIPLLGHGLPPAQV